MAFYFIKDFYQRFISSKLYLIKDSSKKIMRKKGLQWKKNAYAPIAARLFSSRRNIVLYAGINSRESPAPSAPQGLRCMPSSFPACA
jgi:hypothetical protein